MEIQEMKKGFFLEGSKEEAVLLIHGFTGTPAEMWLCADYLNKAGYTVSCPCMPGHGLTMEDQKKSSWDQWLKAEEDEYLRLTKIYAKVDILGLSMGGSMATILAERYTPHALVLYSPALAYQSKAAYFAPVLKILVPKIHWKQQDLFEHNQKYIVGPGGYYLKSVQDMVKLSKIAKKGLKNVKAPMIMIYSLADELVSKKAPELLMKKVSSTVRHLVILTNSGHMIQILQDHDLVFAETVRFLKAVNC
jgi:carboxylesterase